MSEAPIINIKDYNGNDLAMIISHGYDKEGISFFTPGDYSQQVAFMHHPKDHVILPHVHNPNKREILYTNEVLYIRKGKLRCDFYSKEREYVRSVVLESGDLILLISGGHGFTCVEEVEMYEIKQGPYSGDEDKTRFEAVDEGKIYV